jgi:integrase
MIIVAQKFILTDIQVKAAKPGEKLRRVKDGGGLFLVISPSGGKWWEYRYRLQEKETSIGLGSYPDVSLADAREKHSDARKKVKAGINPAAERKAAAVEAKAAGMTFAEATASFLENRQNLKRIGEIGRRLELYILPVLGKLPLAEITTPQLLELLVGIHKRGIEETARRCRTYISQVFQHAVVRGWTPYNPTRELERLPELQRTSKPQPHRYFKTPAELGRFLLYIESRRDGSLVERALWLAPRVFLRSSELCGAEWREFDFSNALWRIPGGRMKAGGAHVVPLSEQVLQHLAELKKITGESDFVFMGRIGCRETVNPESLRMALRRAGYGPHVLSGNSTPHGFRSCASTFLREQGYDPHHIEAQLAHGKRSKIEAAYNHASYIPQRRELMQFWSDYLCKLRDEAAVEADSEPLPDTYAA